MQFWSPLYRKDMLALDRVQWRYQYTMDALWRDEATDAGIWSKNKLGGTQRVEQLWTGKT